MAEAVIGDLARLGQAGFLGQAGQGVVFAQDGMTGPPVPASPMTAVGMPARFSVTRKP